MKSEKYIDTISNEELIKETLYYESGKIRNECYKLNGKYHRKDGPAITHYNEDGSIRNEAYYLNNKWHREDGPAFISYYSRDIEQHWYCLNGNFIKDELQLFVIKTLEIENNKEKKL